MDNNLVLVSGNEYIITIKNTSPSIQYIKTYVDTIENLNRTKIYKFRDNNENITTFRVDSVTVKPYTSNSSSVLGKRQTTTIIDNELDSKKSKVITQEQINKAIKFLNDKQTKFQSGYSLTDEEYEDIFKALSIISLEEHYKWPEFTYLESLDGGKRKNKSKRKTRKIKSKKRKSRKYNK